MTAYIIRRLLILPVIILGVTIIMFSMIQVLGPDKLLAAYVNENMLRTLSADELDKIKTKYGLNDSLIVRYGKWLGNTLRGDLGWSQVGKEPVIKALTHRLPYTMELALYSIIPIIWVGIWLGVKSAVHHNSGLDQSIRIFAIVGWSFPDYVFGILVLMLFYLFLGWFPPGLLSNWAEEILFSGKFRNYTGLISVDSLLNGRPDIFWDDLRHIIGPVITLSYLWWAYLLRITRSAMLEVMQKDYVRTARSKGLSEKNVINVHARRNALIPVATVAGQTIISLFMEVIIVETIFNRPGLGSFAAMAARQLDYASIMGCLVFSSFILIFGNLLVDISYALIDPRIRLS